MTIKKRKVKKTAFFFVGLPYIKKYYRREKP